MQRERWLKVFVLLVPPCALVLLLVLQTLHPRSARQPANIDAGVESDVIAKIEIDPNKLIVANSLNSPGLQLKASQESAVPAGTRLVAILDNTCVNARLDQRSTGALKASAQTLSERAYEQSEKDEIDDLKIQAYAFDASETTTLSQLAAEAEADVCVRHLTDERVRHLNATTVSSTINDPNAATQLHLDYLKAAGGWPLFYSSGLAVAKDVIIAVVDSGVDYTHEDLAANMWHDANGKVGYDFVNKDDEPMDDLGHGTHVAGLIAAVTDNGKGGSGVMGKHAKIMAVKVISGSDQGLMSDFVNGLRWAADHGADVINMSLGGSETTTAERDAVAYASKKGAVLVSAAGNDHKVLTAADNDYPSGYAASVAGALAVGSVDSDTGVRSTFSNYSPNYVYIAAPGAESASGSRGLLSTGIGNTYKRMMGTSMATPIVSAAAGLVIGVLKTQNAPYANSDIVSLLQFASRHDASLAYSFKDGAVLDLERLAKATKYRFMIDGDAGVEDAN